MTIKCIAIDDEPLALELIEALCDDIPYIKIEKTFTQTSEAAKYLRKFPVDLIFLDINMPDVSGIDFYKSIQQECMVIFTTAYSEYAIEGFNLNAVDYILKPIQVTRFKQACDKARDFYEYINNRESTNVNYLYVRSEYALVKIPIQEILYLETLDDYIKIHLLGKKPILTLMSMKKMMERLPQKEFIRIHRSYTVPVTKIDSVRGKSVFVNKIELPIGTSYEKDFFTVYKEDRQ
jgi:DNA-binding LytR/AlgR family response regulator